MKSFRIGEAISVGWERFVRRPWYLLGITLCVCVLFTFAIGDAAVTALAYIVYGGYVGIMFRHYHSTPFVFDDIFSIDQRWIYFAFLGLIKGIVIFLGLLLFVVPGIYLAVKWMFAEFYVITEGKRPLEALQASSELTKGHRWHLFFYSIVVLLLVLLGLVCFLVGAVVASVVTFFATIKVFEDLKKFSQSALEQGEV